MQELYNCSCLSSFHQPGVPDAYDRPCEAETCMQAIVFLLTFAVVVFLMFICFTMNISIMLRLDFFTCIFNNLNLNLLIILFFTFLLVIQKWNVIRMNTKYHLGGVGSISVETATGALDYFLSADDARSETIFLSPTSCMVSFSVCVGKQLKELVLKLWNAFQPHVYI